MKKRTEFNILCRTQADSQTGFGHLMRLLSVSDALREEGCRVELVLGGNAHAFEVTQQYGYQAEAAADFSPAEAGRKPKPDAVLVDSYLYMNDYLSAWRAAGVPVAIIDDLAERGLQADLVINPNITAPLLRTVYQETGAKVILLGLHYALLRKDILAVRDVPPAQKPCVLILFGAADIGRMTAWAVATLVDCAEPFRLDVVLGPAATSLPEVETSVQRALAGGREATLSVAPADLPRRMAQASLAVSAGGVAATELAFLGRPAVLLPVAENQEAAAELWHESNVHYRLKDKADALALRSQVSLLLSAPQLRQAMGAAGRQLIDGKGSRRVADRILRWLETEE